MRHGVAGAVEDADVGQVRAASRWCRPIRAAPAGPPARGRRAGFARPWRSRPSPAGRSRGSRSTLPHSAAAAGGRVAPPHDAGSFGGTGEKYPMARIRRPVTRNDTMRYSPSTSRRSTRNSLATSRPSRPAPAEPGLAVRRARRQRHHAQRGHAPQHRHAGLECRGVGEAIEVERHARVEVHDAADHGVGGRRTRRSAGPSASVVHRRESRA